MAMAYFENTFSSSFWFVMGGTSEPVDKVNLVDEDKDDDDLIELEDVLVTVGTQERTANWRKTSVV